MEYAFFPSLFEKLVPATYLIFTIVIRHCASKPFVQRQLKVLLAAGGRGGKRSHLPEIPL